MELSPPFDTRLPSRYERTGPRHASYPTGPRFSTAFGEAELRQAAQRSNGDPIPRRLSLYLHMPFGLGPGGTAAVRDVARGEIYLSRLYREMELASSLYDRDREVVELHVGGGTPNLLAPAQLAEVVDVVRGHFRLGGPAVRDLTIELDPRLISPAEVAQLAAAGFNRARLGVQDFDPMAQAAVNRARGPGQTLGIIAACHASGMRSVSVELAHGLPGQNLEAFGRTLDTVIKARVERVAVNGNAHMASTSKRELLGLATNRLEAASYVHIGMGQFALPCDSLAIAQAQGTLHRNLMGYTPHPDTDLVGMGVGAISHVGDCFSQNCRDLPAWEAALDQGRLPVSCGLRLTEDDIVRADLIKALVCQGEIQLDVLARRHAIDFAVYFQDELRRLQPLVEDGLVRLEPDRIAITRKGRIVLRDVVMCFDRDLDQA